MPPGRGLAAVCLACGLAAAAGLPGCRPAPPPQVQRPNIQIGPCAERVHDLCGHLLLYYAARRQLPETLAELADSQSLPEKLLVCPVSGRPYVYHRAGLSLPGRQGRLVLHDAEGTHSGMRWGILVVGTPGAGRPITANVILVAEKDFAAAAPAAATQPAAP